MATFGQSGFGGFGTSNNNNQQSTGFGGFGTNNNANNNTTNTGFGAPGFGTTGFGATNNATSGFGGAQTNSGFGTSGFGSTNTGFGSRPAFGTTTANTTTGGSLFGGGAATNANTGFGGFGTNNQASTGFGASTTGGSVFGQTNNQQASGFGTTNTSNSLFGGGNTNTAAANNGFGSSTGSNNGFGGFGAAAAPPAPNTGTGGIPFTEHQEKDNSTMNKFQSINCLPAYVNWSFEELRAVDYNQGRKYGNQGGQAGAFGTSTGFGGFGTNNNATNTGFGTTSTFGQPAAATTGGFGSTQPATTGFGAASTGNSIFGQKPATGGLFGASAGTTTATPSIFGTQTNNNTTGGFGQTSGFGTSSTGTGIFGNQQAKPAFGQPAGTTATTGTGFGTATAGGFGQQQPASGGIFGNAQSTTGGFGQQQNTQTTSAFGTFGQQNQNQNQTQGNGVFGSAFGQNKPAFGSTSTTTGNSIFGQPQQQQQPAGSLFGTTTNNQQAQPGNSLFGPKPATTSLFGTPQNNAATTTSAFGNLNNQNNQTQTQPLFGTSQQKSNPFGNTMASNTGSGLFGQSQSQPAGNSLFGNTQNQQQQSVFGNSLQQSQQQPQQQGGMTASLMSSNPYGNASLFDGLSNPVQSPGPLATPLSSSQKARKPAPLPTYRLSPAASTRLITPQKRSGYGFDYSTYGTPGSASPSLFGASLLQNGRLGSTLGRSLSTSNIRGSLSPSESILNPNAFSSGGLRGSSSSLKKLRINRNIRTDLFGTETNDSQRTSPLKKSVSFGADTSDSETQQIDGAQTNGETSRALVRVEDDENSQPSAEEQGFLRSSRGSDKDTTTTSSGSRQEMEQVSRKSDLASVPENGPGASTTSKASVSAAENARLSQKDQEPGEYFMIPSKADLEKMSRKQLSSVKPFTVGRHGVGKIEWEEVDLSNTDLDSICGKIVELRTRVAAVEEPQQEHGKGLNSPALVTLGNSYPRSAGGRLPVYERKGPRFDKHVERLKRVVNTDFVDYNVERGEWIFRVAHFSTYRLDYEDDDESMFLDSPTPARHSTARSVDQYSALLNNGSSSHTSNVDDTFEFRRSARGLPGAFDSDMAMDNEFDQDMEVTDDGNKRQEAPSARSQGDGSDSMHNTPPMTDDLQTFDRAYESPAAKQPNVVGNSVMPRSIMKASQNRDSLLGGAVRARPTIGADWATQLQHTISPKKQNREALRESQGIFANIAKDKQQAKLGQSTFGRDAAPFATSIDVMNSLFGGRDVKGAKKQDSSSKGFQIPYAKRPKIDKDVSKLIDQDKAFHQSFRPTWAPDGTLVYARDAGILDVGDGMLVDFNGPVETDGRDVHFARFASSTDQTGPSVVAIQRQYTQIEIEDDVAKARISGNDFKFSSFVTNVSGDNPAGAHEQAMWKLASILFDELEVDAGLGNEQIWRKANFDDFWTDLVKPAALAQLDKVSSLEERAIVQLSANDVWGATDTLNQTRNLRLATLIAQIGSAEMLRSNLEDQIRQWRITDTLSEITPAIRTLYELLAGNASVSDGKGNVGAENRAETFNISSRWGLDWKRAFGLRFWYGITPDEPLPAAIRLYWEDVDKNSAGVNPQPWFVEQQGSKNSSSASGQDILWGLLQIYASTQEAAQDDKIAISLKLADILTQQNLSPNPVDARLAFQLYQLLSARGVANFEGSEADRAEKADTLAANYVFQLASTKNPSETLPTAVFAALHLTSADARRDAVTELLNRHAGAIGAGPDTCPLFADLTEKLLIPADWIYSAKALHAKSVLKDEAEQARCLLKANRLEDAHKVLKESVAPRAVVEETLEDLKYLLGAFEVAGAPGIQGWELGGGVYVDFVRLMLRGHEEVDEGVLNRLTLRLPEMSRPGLGLVERVAVVEMGDRVADVVGEAFAEMKPLLVSMAGDRVLQDAVALSDAFYAQVVI